MTLDEFIDGAHLTLEAFRAATLARHETDDPVLFKLDGRSERGWWRELIAYMMCVELEEP